MEFNELHLRDNPGVTKGRLPVEILNNIKNLLPAFTNNNNSYNNMLIGQIEKEFKITTPDDLTKFLLKMVRDYQNRFNFLTYKEPRLADSWVNFQKKHEYNPVHHHFNALGWVSWIQIPYSSSNENQAPNSSKATYKKNGAFEFVYTKLSGEIQTHTISLSKEDEGTIILFPKGLKHLVYPFFTSDDYRISIAGNIDLV